MAPYSEDNLEEIEFGALKPFDQQRYLNDARFEHVFQGYREQIQP